MSNEAPTPLRRFPRRWWIVCVLGTRGPSTSAAIAAELGLRTEQVSDLIDKMRVRDAMVEVVETNKGPRGHVWQLTAAGQSLFAAVRAETRRYVRFIEEAA